MVATLERPIVTEDCPICGDDLSHVDGHTTRSGLHSVCMNLPAHQGIPYCPDCVRDGDGSR